MSHTTRRGPVKPTMNITPLIDVVFLLIVFFMLVSKIVTEEVPELQLPAPSETQAYREQSENRIIVNVVPMEKMEGQVGPTRPFSEVFNFKGDVRDGTAEFITMGSRKWEIASGEQMAEFQTYLAESIAGRLKKQGRPMIFLRCDAAIYYKDAAKVLDMIQKGETTGFEMAGADPRADLFFWQIEIIAYAPPRE